VRVVIAPDSFKGSATAAEVARAIAHGWLSVRSDDDVSVVPMADGGEGTVDAFEASIVGTRRMPCDVIGPDGRPHQAHWLLLPDGVAVIEMANTCGITLHRNLRPLDSSSGPFGEAIAHALEFGVSGILLAIGSSASTDGGVGMLSALGGRFMDTKGQQVALGGRGLSDLASCDLTMLKAVPARGAMILSDVSNPLLGSTGAAATFGPQKGATAAEVDQLDAGLTRLASVMGGDPTEPGAGAAGGTGFGLQAWGASTRLGASVIGELLGLREKILGADLVITGEGMFDHQSTAGKAPGHVISLARAAGVPVAVVAGRITESTEGFAASLALEQLAASLESAIESPARYLVKAAGILASMHDKK
jgi:glycerate kinase